MNNGRIWCVVKPTVGLPLFLGGVAVIALTVHAAVMTNTTWMADYWQGNKPRRAEVQTPSVNVAQSTADQPMWSPSCRSPACRLTRLPSL
ncbi:light-harvesting protein [Elioraea tepida]|uniref:Light-harvesting protein n=1 Tax=Elioraea tepida TaxID=2843330 RepID=A0A975U3T9_9PROT|nr:light-harvesting protein [Elioraea tepida]QXM25228.1 light-harvesting protein [Elioraea tepida]